MTEADGAAAPAGAAQGAHLNALRHGILSRDTVLPWEDEGAYRALLTALADEHRPDGATEAHLVEELAGTIWRKRRLRLAEAALAREGVGRTIERLRQKEREGELPFVLGPGEAVVDALQATPEATWRELARPAPRTGALARLRRRALEDRVSIRTQTLGDAHDPTALQTLARYESHLDRKLERTLALLVKLQQLKRERRG